MTDSQRSAVEQDPTVRFSAAGETVAATRYEPVDVDGPLPAVLWYTPYHKDDETTFGRYDPILEYVAAHGYEVVVADVVGTGASTGRRDEVFATDAGEEVAAVIEAVADLPWTTDRVGMLGKSFPGVLCLAAAAENPDPLAAVVPVLTAYRRRRMAFQRGGLPNLWLPTVYVALYTATALQPPSRRPPGWEEIWRSRLDHYREAAPPLARTLDADPDDPYWDYSVPVEDVEVPTFAVGGYRDHFTHETMEFFDAVDAPKRLLLGPWRHVIPYQGRETAVGFRGQVVDWFDRHLKGESVEPFGPEIAYWTERDGGRQVRRGSWRGRHSWPAASDPGVDPLSFAATPSGLRRAAAFDSGSVERVHEIDHTVGLDAQDLAVPFVDTNAEDARSITFETEPFERPVELTGTGQATVYLRADDAVPVSVRLVDVAPDGRARPIARGSARVDEPAAVDDRDGDRGSDSIDGPDGDERTEARDEPVTVRLGAVSHVVEPGHRLRVAIAAADFPTYVPVGSADSLVVTSTPAAPTVVRIPGTDPAPGGFEETVSMPPPDDSYPLVPPAIEASDQSQETAREHYAGRATRSRHVGADYAFPHVGKSYDLDVEASVVRDDPDSLSATATVETTLEHEEDPVDVAATVDRTRDGATVAARVWLDGETVFEREWSK